MSSDDKDFMSGAGTKVVYVAPVSEEMTSYRDNLIAELVLNGCEVRETDHPYTPDKIVSQIEQSSMAVHLLSEKDSGLSGDQKGFEEEQINISAMHRVSRRIYANEHEDGFKIVAWFPRSFSQGNFQKEVLPQHIVRLEQIEEVELIRTSYEEFKSHLINEITQEKKVIFQPMYLKGDENPVIFFIYDTPDAGTAIDYIEYLNKRGFTVATPDFSRDIMTARKNFETNLCKFDIAIVFADKAQVLWVNMKLMNILKSPGLGREKPIKGMAVMINPERAGQCPLIASGFDIIPLEAGLNSQHLENFIQKIVSR